jgi:hypothetical protein
MRACPHNDRGPFLSRAKSMHRRGPAASYRSVPSLSMLRCRFFYRRIERHLRGQSCVQDAVAWRFGYSHSPLLRALACVSDEPVCLSTVSLSVQQSDALVTRQRTQVESHFRQLRQWQGRTGVCTTSLPLKREQALLHVKTALTQRLGHTRPERTPNITRCFHKAFTHVRHEARWYAYQQKLTETRTSGGSVDD